MDQELKNECSIENRIMIHSGVKVLKNAIADYIVRYAYPMKVRALLQCFEDILTDLKAINSKTMEEFEEVKKEYGNAADSREEKQKEEETEKKREEILLELNKELSDAKTKIDLVSETVSEIDSIRASFITMKSSIAVQIGDSEKIEKRIGKLIIDSINDGVNNLLTEIEETVAAVKEKKKQSVNSLYDEFIKTLQALNDKGFLIDGTFNLADTVEYKQIVDKDSFSNPEETVEIVKNPIKEHINLEFNFSNIKPGKGFFKRLRDEFTSMRDKLLVSTIGALVTWDEPDTVDITYIDVKKYYDDNIEPLTVEIEKYVDELKKSYKKDIEGFKTNAKQRVDAIGELISNQRERINSIHRIAMGYADDEQLYNEEMNRLYDEGMFLTNLMNKISHVKI